MDENGMTLLYLDRVTTCMENLEMTGNLTVSGKCQGFY